VLFHLLPSLALGVIGGELGACAAGGYWLPGSGVIVERLNLGVYLWLALFHLHPLLLFLYDRPSFTSFVSKAVLLPRVPVSLRLLLNAILRVFCLVGLVGLNAIGLPGFFVLPVVVLPATFLVLVLVLRAELPLGAGVLGGAFLAGAVDLLLPLVVNELVVCGEGGEQFLQLTLKDTVAEIVPLQAQQFLHLALQLRQP